MGLDTVELDEAGEWQCQWPLAAERRQADDTALDGVDDAMRDWQWWHVLGLWLAAALVGGLLLRAYSNVFGGGAEGGGGPQAAGTPPWLLAVLLVLAAVLVVATWSWWRGRSGRPT